MKVLKFEEFARYTTWCESILVGAQLQDVLTNDELVVLEFYKFRNIWLVIDLSLAHPQFVLCQSGLPSFRIKQKPVGLFLASHGENLRLQSFRPVLQKGRVAQLELEGGLSNSRSCLIEIQVVPRVQNIIVTTPSPFVVSEQSGLENRMTSDTTAKNLKTTVKYKTVSWDRPQELPTLAAEPDLDPSAPDDIGAWLDRESEWKSERLMGVAAKTAGAGRAANGSAGGGRGAPNLSTALEKKRKALAALTAQLENDEADRRRELAEILQSQEPAPARLQKYLDPKISAVQNVQKLFAAAKQLESKKAGTAKRIEILNGEILQLDQRLRAQIENPLAALNEKAPTTSLISKKMQKVEAAGRKLKMDEGLEAVCGKSAADNLAILRQARAWDYWMHLKDYPGAHAIIFREKKQNVSRENFQKVAEWMIRESKAAKGFSWGQPFDVVVAECRFVKPIKGDKLGRVTYSNIQVYSFASNTKL